MFEERFLMEAFKEAKIAYKEKEIPIGAVVVKDGVIIGRGHNKKENLNDVTAHAELIAIKEAEKTICNWRLYGCSLYVTVEPCIMCASAIIQSRISEIHIGTYELSEGGFGSMANIPDFYGARGSLRVNWIYDKECQKLMEDFFKELRGKCNKSYGLL